jgi:hypothetical protein
MALVCPGVELRGRPLPPSSRGGVRASQAAALIAAMGFSPVPGEAYCPGGQLFLPSFVVVMLVAFIGYSISGR